MNATTDTTTGSTGATGATGDTMPEYGRWEESKGRIDDRFQRLEKTIDAINGNISKLVWIGLTAFLTLLGHVIVSYLQMKGPG